MKFRLLSLVLFSTLFSFNLIASNPTSSKVKPTKEIKYWCEVKGTYTQTTLSDGGTLEECRVKYPAEHCYFFPCSADSQHSFKTVSVSVPIGVNIEEGQPFFARFVNGEYQIVYLNTLDIIEQQTSDGVQLIIIKH